MKFVIIVWSICFIIGVGLLIVCLIPFCEYLFGDTDYTYSYVLSNDMGEVYYFADEQSYAEFYAIKSVTESPVVWEIQRIAIPCL